MKLHLGCGRKFIPGYVHVDIIPFEHVEHVTDIRDLSIFKDQSVNEIYACHVLEHAKRMEVPDVLKEWNRILKPKGTIRIAVPDFEAIADEYLKRKDLSHLLGLIYGGQNYDYNYHHVTFDFNILSNLLSQAGFTNISRYDWRDFLPQDYDDYSRAYLPHMDFKNGRLMSLNVIAQKNE